MYVESNCLVTDQSERACFRQEVTLLSEYICCTVGYSLLWALDNSVPKESFQVDITSYTATVHCTSRDTKERGIGNENVCVKHSVLWGVAKTTKDYIYSQHAHYLS